MDGSFLDKERQLTRPGRYSRKDPNAKILGDLVLHLFPQLLVLSQRVLASAPTDAASLQQQGSLLHLILKSYKNSIASSLTPAQQAPDSLIPWGTLFLAITTRALPLELLSDDAEDREKHPWSKAKKWAVHSLNRLFMRYGSPSQLASNMKGPYGAFADRFVHQFAPEILRTYLGLVERNVGGEWVPSKVKHHILVFFEEWCACLSVSSVCFRARADITSETASSRCRPGSSSSRTCSRCSSSSCSRSSA